MVERGGAARAAIAVFVVGTITAGLLALPREAAGYDAMVSWQAVSGATSYRVYVRNGDGAYQLAKERSAASGTTVRASTDRNNMAG